VVSDRSCRLGIKKRPSKEKKRIRGKMYVSFVDVAMNVKVDNLAYRPKRRPTYLVFGKLHLSEEKKKIRGKTDGKG